VDEELGYPHGYAKLCRHAAAQLQGLLTPFTEGPPQRFLPYAPQTEDVSSFTYQTKTNGHGSELALHSLVVAACSASVSSVIILCERQQKRKYYRIFFLLCG